MLPSTVTATYRERTEQLEQQTLHPFAIKSADTKGRALKTEPCRFRTEFQRDRDKILHSKAFRRLKHKTQVFISPSGDHYRTRLTHSLEVSQIARTVSRALRLNEDLTEAVALGHDLGHPPFGHAGEDALTAVYPEGFSHSEQSVRIVTLLEPLNLTCEVLDGIQSQGKQTTSTCLEAHVVALADRMAYLHHDVEDAMRAGMMTEEAIPLEIRQTLGKTRSDRLTAMVTDLITCSEEAFQQGKPEICMSSEIHEAMMGLRAWMFQNIYHSSHKEAQEERVHRVVASLYVYFQEHPEHLPSRLYQIVSAPEKEESPALTRRIVDYIAGMTDRFALETYMQLFLPVSLKTKDISELGWQLSNPSSSFGNHSV